MNETSDRDLASCTWPHGYRDRARSHTHSCSRKIKTLNPLYGKVKMQEAYKPCNPLTTRFFLELLSKYRLTEIIESVLHSQRVAMFSSDAGKVASHVINAVTPDIPIGMFGAIPIQVNGLVAHADHREVFGRSGY